MSRPAARPGPRLRPTRLGVAFLGLVMLTLVGCINYGLSLGYGLTFLLGGLWVVTAAQVVRAIRLLSVTVLPPASAVAGQPVTFTAQVQQLGPAGNVRVEAQPVQVAGLAPVRASGVVRPGDLTSLSLTVPSPQRGPLRLTGVRLVAVDVLGLWHASLPAEETAEVSVSPAPEVGAPPAPATTLSGAGETGRRRPGQEEFAGVRGYQPGDSPRLISWKHVARTGNLLTREFDAPAGQALALDWADTTPAGDTEARLSRLAAWVAQARDQGQAFSLNLPGRVLSVGGGEGQVRAALTALAQVAPLPAPPEQKVQTGFLDRPAWLQGGRPAPGAPRQGVSLPSGAAQFSLLALGFALIPGLVQWPVWIGALLLGLLGYSALQLVTPPSLTRPGRSLPALSPVLLLALALGAGLGLKATYGTLLGQQAGTAILAALLCLKAAETRTIRDAKLLSLLGLFLLITHFFHSQGPLTALHAVLAAWLLLAAGARWVNPDTWAGGLLERAPWRHAGRLLLLAAPLAALLFMFFPRPDGPLWRLPLQQNQTGLSDEIAAGEFSNLAQSRAVAFRADFQGGTLPPPEQRYWRGPIYENYDGLKWTQAMNAGFIFARPSLEVEKNSAAYRYTLTLEPNGKPWLLALDTPTMLPQGALLTTGFQAATFRPATRRSRYEFQSQAARLGRAEDTRRLQLDLYVPAGQNPRATALATSWRSLPPGERVAEAAQFLGQGGFAYTLNPPTLPQQNRIDAFLFGTKRGFCEHYASAFAFLMRAAGVPARVVGGYQGGEVNPSGGYLIVRQQDAHAWTEVWLQGQGWVRVDPTALIAPARISTNLGTALTQPRATAALARTPLAALALRLDAFQNNWNNWVAGYNGEQQRSILSRLGIGGIGSAPYMLALGAVVGLLLLPILALVRRAARPRDPALAALHDLSEKLRLPRAPGETASDYAARAAGQYPTLRQPLLDIAALFNQLRYGPDQESAEKQRELSRSIRQLKR